MNFEILLSRLLGIGCKVTIELQELMKMTIHAHVIIPSGDTFNVVEGYSFLPPLRDGSPTIAALTEALQQVIEDAKAKGWLNSTNWPE